MNYFWKIWLAELNPSFQHDLTLLFNMTHRNWNLLFNMTQRNWTHFKCDSKSIFILKISDSKNKLIFFENIRELNLLSDLWPKRTELFFNLWLKELNTFECDSKELTFFFSIWLKDLNPFLNVTQRIEPLLWTWLKDFVLWIWLEEFFYNDYKNWILWIKNWFTSASHVEKRSILWVFKRRVLQFVLFFKKKSHFFNGSIPWVILKKNQCFENVEKIIFLNHF